MDSLMIGWTTTPTKEVAEDLARALVRDGLAACVHIEGPISAYFHWNQKVEYAEEYKMTIKFLARRAQELEAWIGTHHPYDTPEWIATKVDFCSKGYLRWAQEKMEV